MQRFKFLPFAALLTLMACGGPAVVTEAEVMEGEWTFSLANEAKANRLDMFLGAGRILYPDSRLVVEEDSLIFTNPYNDKRVAELRLRTIPTVDSIKGYLVEPGFGQTLRLADYEGDSLKNEYIFERPDERLKPILIGGIDDQGFHFKYPGQEELFVYFNQADDISPFYPEGKTVEYFYSHIPSTQERRSVVFKDYPGRHRENYFFPEPLRNIPFFLFNENNAFGKYRHVLYKKPNGTIITTWISQDSNRYVRNEMVLSPAPSVCPPGATGADFAAQFNAGRLVIDNNYPRIDSADVAYLYTDRYLKYGGLEFDELAELEMSFDPEGAFIMSSRGQVIKDMDWELKPAGNLIELSSTTQRVKYCLPILSWTDELIEFRMPLMVKTREPRGVEMESYGLVDAYVRLESPGGATSSR